MTVLKFFRPLKPESADLLHLDVLRFVASCAVVFNHSGEFFFSPAVRPLFYQHIGALGVFVDMFFVISGYVIAFVYNDRVGTPARYGAFLQRRFGRLVPLHWIVLILVILLGYVLVMAHVRAPHGGMFAADCIWTSALLLNSMGICPSLAFNGASWSISAEVVMYLAFPLFVFIASRYRHALLVTSLALSIWLFWAQPFSLTLGPWYLWTYAGGPIRALPSFLFGIWLFNNRGLVALLPHPAFLMFAALAALIPGIALNAPVPLLFLIVYLTVAAGVAADLTGRRSALIWRAAPFGQLTYSIYMIHSFVILVVLNAFADKLLKFTGLKMALAGVVCYAVIGAASYCSLLWVETPLRKLIDGVKIWNLPSNGRPPKSANPATDGYDAAHSNPSTEGPTT